MGRRARIAVFTVVFLAPFLVQSGFALALPDGGTAGSPALLFAIVIVAASLCVLTAGLVIRRGFMTETPELAWLGLFFMAVSLLPLVHGITTPDVLYGPNAATMVSLIVAIPLGALAAAPTLLPRHGRLARAWRGWTRGWLAVFVAIGLWFLMAPDLIAAPNMRTPFGIACIALSTLACLVLGWRHVRLARIAGRAGPLVVAFGYSLVAGSFAAMLGSQPFSAGFWLAHALDIGGVFAGTIAAFIVYRRSASMSEVLAPIVAVEPIAALEVGMHPDVIDFVADLDDKDPMTRDHVVRTAELAIQVAALMRLPAEQQRDAGLAGALHDIGKLDVPDDILKKPGSLNDVEWRIMRSHAALGAEIVSRSEALSSLAPAVRGHHERVDGGGYPDGLAGESIPLLARIVSVCDAYDAMAYTRRYRSGMPLPQVLDILRQNAGTQWDPLVVQAVIRLVSQHPIVEPQLLATHRVERCDCLPENLDGLDDPTAAPSGAFSASL